jgi:uncharacterized protein (TIGR00299 family) protein
VSVITTKTDKRILYLDCFSGISGDMFLGAMLDLGLSEEEFLNELNKLPLPDYEVIIKKSIKGGITGTDVTVKTHEHHPHRGLKQIYEIIDSSEIKPEVKELSKKAFYRLAAVEGGIHGKSPEEIHFHEVGAVDSIIDIVGACILIDILKPDKVYASPVNVGSGTVKCAHGILPIPAPATMSLLKGMPIYSGDEQGEFTTPTGALLLSMFVDQFDSMPSAIPEKTGYGLGKSDRKSPNVLRVVLLKEYCNDVQASDFEQDKVVVLEANIDDMNPELYDSVFESLFQKGALDVFLTPIIMKKGRPAVKLTCLCFQDKKNLLAEAILKETTSLGVRETEANRTKLYREIKEIKTTLGNLKVKIAKIRDENIRVTPEYDDLKRIAKEKGIPLIKAYELFHTQLIVK